MGTTLFASDVHLSAQRPDIITLFIDLLGRARQVEHLYLLGDCFDRYLGDDDTTAPNPAIIEALRDLTKSGVPVSVVRGNHDFLFGANFSKMTGCTLLPDHCVIEVNGTRVLIMHGDTLCIDDHSYQTFRRYSREPGNQQAFLAKPLEERIVEAEHIRKQSKQATQLKTNDIMDVNQEAVRSAMCEHGVSLLLHGHTHRPAIHNFMIDDEHAKRIVLGDWYERDTLLLWDDNGYRFSTVADLAMS